MYLFFLCYLILQGLINEKNAEYLTILIGYIKIPISLLISYLFLKENISYYKIIGSILIIIGISYSDIENHIVKNHIF